MSVMSKEEKKNSKAYQQGREDERRRIVGLLSIDLLLLETQNPEELVKRALQLIENPNLFD